MKSHASSAHLRKKSETDGDRGGEEELLHLKGWSDFRMAHLSSPKNQGPGKLGENEWPKW